MAATPVDPDAPGEAHAPAERQVRSTAARTNRNRLFNGLAIIGTTCAITILFILLATVVLQGIGRLNGAFISSMASYKPEEAGVFAALIGTVIVCAICALTALPLGVGSAILIEEFRPTHHPLASRIHGIIETNIRNLAGVPSIVYGILGVTAFATMFGLLGIAGKSGFSIGQRWYDQYADAQGHLLFVPVDDYEVPQTPLYDGPVTTPQRIEVWGADRRPILIGTETVVEVPQAGDDPASVRRQDVQATLAVRDGGWVIQLTNAAAQAVDLSKLGINPGDQVRFGFLFDQFSQRSIFSQFTIRSVGPGEVEAFGGPVTSFLDAADPDAQTVTRQVMARDSFGPMVSEIEAALGEFEDVIQEGINATREGRRNTGPAQIDRAAAEAIVDQAIAAGPFANDDIDALREKLVGQVLALDGKGSSELRAGRRELTNAAVEAEKQSRLRGKVLAGQNPNRVDYKSWYYLSLPFGRGVLAGGLTLMLVILPIVIVASQEALRAVPASYRQGALALGATKWQAVSKTALPAAIPGICTGTILAMSRAIGEAAPILILGGVVFINFTPGNLMDSFTVMPLQIYNWAGQPQDAYRELAAAGIIVLMTVLLCFNALAIYIRQRSNRHR